MTTKQDYLNYFMQFIEDENAVYQRVKGKEKGILMFKARA